MEIKTDKKGKRYFDLTKSAEVRNRVQSGINQAEKSLAIELKYSKDLQKPDYIKSLKSFINYQKSALKTGKLYIRI